MSDVTWFSDAGLTRAQSVLRNVQALGLSLFGTEGPEWMSIPGSGLVDCPRDFSIKFLVAAGVCLSITKSKPQAHQVGSVLEQPKRIAQRYKSQHVHETNTTASSPSNSVLGKAYFMGASRLAPRKWRSMMSPRSSAFSPSFPVDIPTLFMLYVRCHDSERH